MNEKSLTIAFAQPVVSHARFHKRVNELKKLGVKPKIISFQRDYYKGKQIDDELVLLGTIKQRQYKKRIAKIVVSLRKMYKVLHHVDIVYAFGLEMLAIAWVTALFHKGRCKFIYEIGDIREIFLKNHLEGRILRALEKFFLRRIDLLVVTSEAYLREYYLAILHMDRFPYLVIENKIDDSYPVVHLVLKQKRDQKRIKIGYFGMIRCKRSWEVLKKIVIESEGQFEVLARGVVRRIESFEKDVKKINGLFYKGPYVAPDDLPEIYGEVDLVWIAHHHGEVNLKWARANRFYESCFFRKPMIAQKNTLDGNVVRQYQLGLIIDLTDIDESVGRIVSLTRDDIEKWQENLDHVPNELYTYTTEHKQLLDRLK